MQKQGRMLRRLAVVCAVAGVAIAAATLGCSSKARLPEKVVIVGIDAADWAVIRPLMDAGRLPNFARLVARGATGSLATLQPLQKSPVIWTSIATGVFPDKHGIGGFLARSAKGDSVPYTRNVRRMNAIWEILGERGIKVAVVGWMVTWPAQEVNGYLVSDYIQYENEKGIKLERQTYPETLFDEIDGMRLTEQEVPDEAVASIFPLEAAGQPGVEPWHKGYVKMVYAVDETFRRIAFYLNRKDVKFLTVYFNGADSMCHAFWHARSEQGHPLQGVIDNYYVWIDGVLGQFMDLLDGRTLLVVCSDHGFNGPRYASDGSVMLGVYVHGDFGIVGFMGAGVRKGARIPDADVLDITPTILYALGYPVARDMDGGVLTDAFDLKFLKANPVAFIPTYETGRAQPGEPVESPVDDKVRERLRALGYIQ